MLTMTKKQLEDYNRLLYRQNIRKDTYSDGLRLICEANNYDPEAIDEQMLETYAEMKVEGTIK